MRDYTAWNGTGCATGQRAGCAAGSAPCSPAPSRRRGPAVAAASDASREQFVPDSGKRLISIAFPERGAPAGSPVAGWAFPPERCGAQTALSGLRYCLEGEPSHRGFAAARISGRSSRQWLGRASALLVPRHAMARLRMRHKDGSQRRRDCWHRCPWMGVAQSKRGLSMALVPCRNRGVVSACPGRPRRAEAYRSGMP